VNVVRVGFVGAGWMGAGQLKILSKRADVRICALLEPNIERASALLKELSMSPELLTQDYQRIVDDPEIDAVWLASPNCFHGPQSIAALLAGKHVFCEKPSATSYGDHCAQVELQRRHPELISYVDYILYFDQMERKLRTMVARGTFGTVSQIQVNYRHPVNISGDKAWKLKKHIMGDAIGMGINHALSVMLFAMASQGKPVEVYATSQQARVRGFEADPVWNILIRFDNGASGFCFGNIDNGNGYDAYHNLYGTDGAFVFDSGLERAQKIRYWSAKETGGKWIYPLDAERCWHNGAANFAWPADSTTPDSGNVIDHQLGSAIDHFLSAVKSGSASPLSFTGAAGVAEVGWAAQASAASGKPVRLPLTLEAVEVLKSLGGVSL
jgi:predicted dehydrogenase